MQRHLTTNTKINQIKIQELYPVQYAFKMQLNGHQLYSIACSLARVLLLRGLRDIMRASSVRLFFHVFEPPTKANFLSLCVKK